MDTCTHPCLYSDASRSIHGCLCSRVGGISAAKRDHCKRCFPPEMGRTECNDMAPDSSSFSDIANVPLQQVVIALLLVKSKPTGLSCQGKLSINPLPTCGILINRSYRVSGPIALLYSSWGSLRSFHNGTPSCRHYSLLARRLYQISRDRDCPQG